MPAEEFGRVKKQIPMMMMMMKILTICHLLSVMSDSFLQRPGTSRPNSHRRWSKPLHIWCSMSDQRSIVSIHVSIGTGLMNAVLSPYLVDK